jgi:hypothetical protein
MNALPRARSGFASIVALMMIALVGGAILAVTSLLAADVKRTQTEAREAQLRQLIIAGAQDLAARRRDGEQLLPNRYSLPLPTALTDATVEIHLHVNQSPLVQATLRGDSVEQTIESGR